MRTREILYFFGTKKVLFTYFDSVVRKIHHSRRFRIAFERFGVYMLNILIIIQKTKSIIYTKAFFKDAKDYCIIANLLFVVFKSCEYYIFWGYTLSV